MEAILAAALFMVIGILGASQYALLRKLDRLNKTIEKLVLVLVEKNVITPDEARNIHN